MTPGPWSVVLMMDMGTSAQLRRVQFKGSDGRGALLVQHDGSEEGRANEAVALAAPELLEALEAVATLFPATDPQDAAHYRANAPATGGEILRMRAAIKRARDLHPEERKGG